MLIDSSLRFLTIEYKVVVLPEPVGPDARIIPFGALLILSIRCKSSGVAPTNLIFLSTLPIDSAVARIRITIFSLLPTGIELIRKS